jgi:hypothetical protein
VTEAVIEEEAVMAEEPVVTEDRVLEPGLSTLHHLGLAGGRESTREQQA